MVQVFPQSDSIQALASFEYVAYVEYIRPRDVPETFASDSAAVDAVEFMTSGLPQTQQLISG